MPTTVQELAEKLAESFDGFKAHYNERLDAECKEREALELKIGRASLNGHGPTIGGPAGLIAGGEEYKAVNGFVRTGNDIELKAMSVGSDPDGGYFVLPKLSANMIVRIRDMSPMRQLCRVESMDSGDAFEEIDDRDEAGASWTGEHDSRAATSAPDVGKIRIELDEIYAMPVVTQKLLDDASRDLGAWLESKLADKFGRTEGAAFVNGTGVGRPRGLLTYPTTAEADGTRAYGKIQHVITGNASSLGSSNQADVLRTMMWKLRTPYRNGATWTMNSNTAATIDKLKDGMGDYIWRTGQFAGAPSSLLGYPVAIDEEMPDIGANAYPIAFGNFNLAYLIIERPGIKLLRDPFTNKPNVNFYATRRVGGGLANDDAVKLLKVSAT